MIRRVTDFQYPLLGRVPVRCQCGDWRPLNAHVSCQVAGGEDGSTILATDDPAEVAELCATRYVCHLCGGTAAEELCEDDKGEAISVCASCQDTSFKHVTARWFLWRGEPVDWEAVFTIRTGDTLALDSPPRVGGV